MFGFFKVSYDFLFLSKILYKSFINDMTMRIIKSIKEKKSLKNSYKKLAQALRCKPTYKRKVH